MFQGWGRRFIVRWEGGGGGSLGSWAWEWLHNFFGIVIWTFCLRATDPNLGPRPLAWSSTTSTSMPFDFLCQHRSIWVALFIRGPVLVPEIVQHPYQNRRGRSIHRILKGTLPIYCNAMVTLKTARPRNPKPWTLHPERVLQTAPNPFTLNPIS